MFSASPFWNLQYECSFFSTYSTGGVLPSAQHEPASVHQHGGQWHASNVHGGARRSNEPRSLGSFLNTDLRMSSTTFSQTSHSFASLTSTTQARHNRGVPARHARSQLQFTEGARMCGGQRPPARRPHAAPLTATLAEVRTHRGEGQEEHEDAKHPGARHSGREYL